MFTLFDKKPIHDAETVRWIFDCYGWALRNLDASIFFNQTELVYPNNDYFPGEEHSPDGKSTLILDQVKRHAGLEKWPVRLVDENTYLESSFASSAPKLQAKGLARGSVTQTQELALPEKALYVLYQPDLLRNPQALIANYAHTLANYLCYTVTERPPGGADAWPILTEVIGIFMGFGLMYANTSGNVRVSSCGSCQGPVAERVNYLSQYDATYALAIFVALKNIDAKQVYRYLKKPLHTFFKKALAEIPSYEQEMKFLRAYSS